MIQRITLFIAMVLCPLQLVHGDDWPQWRGPERTGISKEKGLLPSWPPGGPKLLWTFREAGAGYASMAVVGDRLYSMGAEGNKEYVFAIDLKTRKKLWSVEVGPLYTNPWIKGPCGTPTVDGNLVYAIGGQGDLVCVDSVSGKKVWSLAMKKSLNGDGSCDGYTESPLVDGDLLLATPGGKKGTIAAFDKKTGTLKWRSTDLTMCAGNSSIIPVQLGGLRLFVQSTGGSVVGVRAADGKALWKFGTRATTIAGACSTPIYHNECVYYSAGYRGGCSLVKLIPDGNKCDIQVIYTNMEMQNHYGGVILIDDYLYGYSDKGGWVCQDFKTGKTIWCKDPRKGKGSVTYADGNLYCYHEDRGDVLLIKATSDGYKELGSFRIPEETKLPRKIGRIYTHPVVANGKLYLRDEDLIFCYDISKSK